MRLNRLFIVCCSALALLGIAGCKKIIRIDVNSSLAPVGQTVVPGQILEWVAVEPDESFTVSFEQPGLCIEQGPVQVTYKVPGKCTVRDQKRKRGDPPTVYNYTLQGTVHGMPIKNPIVYTVAVSGPVSCSHCKHE